MSQELLNSIDRSISLHKDMLAIINALKTKLDGSALADVAALEQRHRQAIAGLIAARSSLDTFESRVYRNWVKRNSHGNAPKMAGCEILAVQVIKKRRL
jgi:hypothetical protein